MVVPENRDVRLEQINRGEVEPRRPSETIEAELWPAVAIGATGFLAGIGSGDLPIVGDLFGGGGGGSSFTMPLILLVLVLVALLVLSIQL